VVAALFAWLALAGTMAQGQAADAAGPRLIRQMVSVEGQDRPYFYYLPSTANRSTYIFVVFALHDNGQSVEQFAQQSGWLKLAEDKGFAVVFPQAGRGAWAPTSGGDDAYLKAVFDHARTRLSLAPAGAGQRGPGAPGGGGPGPGGGARGPGARGPGGPGGEGGEGEGGGGPPRDPNRIPTWLTWYYLTGSGAGGTAAETFAINYPGLFAGVATLDAAPFEAAYRKGDAAAQNYFQFMRAGKNAEPSWTPLKKQTPEAVWLFDSKGEGAAQNRLIAYWKRSDAITGAPKTQTIAGLRTAVYSNAVHPSEQVRVTKLPASQTYDETVSSAIWNDFFAHVARWTSSPNGDLGPTITADEASRLFDEKTIQLSDGRPSKYYVKAPSSYRPGQHLPVVISLHGAFFGALAQRNQSRFDELGEKEGFITVYANAHDGNVWNFDRPDGPDQEFMLALVPALIRDYGVDPRRVYLEGFSIGSGMTLMMGLSYPQLFAAVSPNSGIGPLSKDVTAWDAGVKAKSDVRIPMMIVYGDVDNGGSVDASIPAHGVLRDAIDVVKSFDHITVPDRYETFASANAAPYAVLTPGAKVEHLAIDAHYPKGRFTTYRYFSADAKPLNLFDFVWVKDMAHGMDPREPKVEWDFFKHWSRNPDGSLNYAP
jgi:poly(3-hydroxybutyrate) depolymerase